MSDTVQFYVVDDAKLPFSLPPGSEEQKHRQLVEAVQKNGAHWGELKTWRDHFILALEAIDREYLGGTRFLAIAGVTHPPHKLLSPDGNWPPIGYYTPPMVKDIAEVFSSLTPAELTAFYAQEGRTPPEREALETVLLTLQDAIEEAARRRYGVAVLYL